MYKQQHILHVSLLHGNPKDRGAWQATVHGVTRVGQDLVTKRAVCPMFYFWLSSNSTKYAEDFSLNGTHTVLSIRCMLMEQFIGLAEKVIWLMNTLFIKVLGENENVSLIFSLKPKGKNLKNRNQRNILALRKCPWGVHPKSQ